MAALSYFKISVSMRIEKKTTIKTKKLPKLAGVKNSVHFNNFNALCLLASV